MCRRSRFVRHDPRATPADTAMESTRLEDAQDGFVRYSAVRPSGSQDLWNYSVKFG